MEKSFLLPTFAEIKKNISENKNTCDRKNYIFQKQDDKVGRSTLFFICKDFISGNMPNTKHREKSFASMGVTHSVQNKN